MSKQDDRAKNPHGGEVVLSEFDFPSHIANKMHLTENQYVLIGKIFVHWSQVEADITSSLFLMKGFNGNEDEAAKLDEKPLDQRTKQLKVLFEEPGHEEPLNSLTALLGIIESEKWKRDVLAHGALLFSHEADASFFLQSRKIELNFDQILKFEQKSTAARGLARTVYEWCITKRTDRRGVPLQWKIANFSTCTFRMVASSFSGLA